MTYRKIVAAFIIPFLICLFLLDSVQVSAKTKTYVIGTEKKITLSGEVAEVKFDVAGFRGTAYILRLSEPVYIKKQGAEKRGRKKVKEIQLTPNTKKVKKMAGKRKVKVKGTLFQPVSRYYIRAYALSVE